MALPGLVALGIIALLLYAYRNLLERPFAADDFQWLLNVYALNARALLYAAFDASAQTHFYRPLVWMLFWLQTQWFGLEPHGYHLVSLALHMLNAGLLGALVYRLQIASSNLQNNCRSSAAVWLGLLAAAFIALHPAPFEAVVWISAQSELLAAALLLLMAHAWLGWQTSLSGSGLAGRLFCSLLATLALILALLAKESAAIGLGLLVVLGIQTVPSTQPARNARIVQMLFVYLPPALITAMYLLFQSAITQRNYLLQEGGYGFGPQLLLNPLRSLALLVAPLAGTEHANAGWLVPLGALLALALLALLASGSWRVRRSVLLLLLTLLPTAPFASPPDSRYLYLPALAAGACIALGLGELSRRIARGNLNRRFAIGLQSASLIVILLFAWFAISEIGAREHRFAAASGPGGSLWRLTTSTICAANPPAQIIVLDPPLAPPHAEAIIQLACGPGTQPLIISRTQLAEVAAPESVVVSFPHGSAELE